jgi:hypothetical protein
MAKKFKENILKMEKFRETIYKCKLLFAQPATLFFSLIKFGKDLPIPWGEDGRQMFVDISM